MSKERKEFELKFQPLAKFYKNKEDPLKEREAIFFNQSKVQIFRGEDFMKYTTKYFDKINATIPTEFQQKDSITLARYLINSQIIVRLERHPEDPGKRWPRKTILTKKQIFDEESFFTWNIVIKNKMNNVKMGIILFLVFMVFLYPIWPFTFKYAIFKITLYLCIFFVGLLVVRLIAYLISRLFGFSFWILPNINDDSMGLLGSFKPLYSIYRFSDGKLEIFFRLLGIVGLVCLLYFLSQEPQYLLGFHEASEQTVDDLLEWGRSKLEGTTEPLHRRAIPDLRDLMRQEEEEKLKEQINANEFQSKYQTGQQDF